MADDANENAHTPDRDIARWPGRHMEPSYDVFFSYNGKDGRPVEEIAHALRQRGLNVFLDRWYLIPGRPWLEELERILRSSRAAAIFIGPEGLGPWQKREFSWALEYQVGAPDFSV